MCLCTSFNTPNLIWGHGVGGTTIVGGHVPPAPPHTPWRHEKLEHYHLRYRGLYHSSFTSFYTATRSARWPWKSMTVLILNDDEGWFPKIWFSLPPIFWFGQRTDVGYILLIFVLVYTMPFQSLSALSVHFCGNPWTWPGYHKLGLVVRVSVCAKGWLRWNSLGDKSFTFGLKGIFRHHVRNWKKSRFCIRFIVVKIYTLNQAS